MPTEHTAHDPEWLSSTYGISWKGESETHAGRFALVLKITDDNTNQCLVVRVTNQDKISKQRLEMVHRFQEYLFVRGVYTGLPIQTSDGKTLTSDEENSRIVEVFPFLEGRSPQRGNLPDTRLVARALAAFHNAGVDYLDLPDEESLDQNHVALQRLRVEVQQTLRDSVGKLYHALLQDYLGNVDTCVSELETLRPDLVETSLHLNAGPNIIIIGNDGHVWFIDCSHMVHGSRVFEVIVSTNYMNISSVAPLGDPVRYNLWDPELGSAFMKVS
jgi:Ser/Thr protein kinase RdoA (MazF antagonist)